jgi:hypothetical protein
MNRILNPEIKNYLTLIIDIYSEIYGTQYKELISKKINNTDFIFYNNPDSLKSFIISLQNEKSRELTHIFLNKINKTDLKEIMFQYDDIISAYSPFALIENFEHKLNSNISENEKSRIINSLISVLNGLGYDIDKSTLKDRLNDSDIKKGINEIRKWHIYRNLILCHYSDFEKSIEPYTELIKNNDLIKEQILEKKIVDFLMLNKKYLSEDDINLLKKDKPLCYLNSGDVLYKYNLGNKALIDSFSTDSNKILEDIKTPTEVVEEIKKNRIIYWKICGIDLGDMYDDYINSVDIHLYIPNSKEVDAIIKSREKYLKQFIEEYYFQTNMKNVLDKVNESSNENSKSLDIESLENNIICVVPNVKDNVLKPQLFFTTTFMKNYLDVMMMHELCHIIELDIESLNNNKIIYKSGFDTHIDDSDETRKFELINEVITQMIADEATKKLHDNGVYIFEDKDIAKVSGGTSYESGNVILINFYEKYKKTILKSRIEGNIGILYDEVGKENFEHLNELLQDYFEIPTYSLMFDLMEKKESDHTKKFHQIIERVKKVGIKMDGFKVRGMLK